MADEISITNSTSDPVVRAEALRVAFRSLALLGKLHPEDGGWVPERDAIAEARESLMDGFEQYVGECAECAKVLIEGDPGHRCHDGEAYLCDEHAYTWADVHAQWMSGEHGGSADERACFLKHFDQHVAGGGLATDKMLAPL